MSDLDNDLRLYELAHRFKNLLTIVRAIVSQSLKSTVSIEEAGAAIDTRLATGAVEKCTAGGRVRLGAE